LNNAKVRINKLGLKLSMNGHFGVAGWTRERKLKVES
jgi:hypothetical protein